MQNRWLLAPLLLAVCDAAPADTPQIAWDAVPALLATCTVTEIYQGHDRWVILTTSDGARVAAREPQIDLVFAIMQDRNCPADQEILVIME